jgi:hypothetical protein
LVCPDCGTTTKVPPAPPRKKKIDVMADAGDGYGLVGYDPSQPQASTPRPERARQVEAEPPTPRLGISLRRRKRRRLPEHPFLEGTFDFPFSPSVRVRALVLTGWALLPPIMVFTAKSAGAMHESLGSAAIVYWFFCAMLMSAATVVFLLWYVVACATMVVVMRETSEGCDAIEDWPGPVFVDWILDALWIFIAASVAVMPGATIAWQLAKYEIRGDWIVVLSGFFLLPIVLLSMLETNSMFGVISWPVLRSLFTTTAGWLMFYATSILLFVAAGILDGVASWLGHIVGGIISAFTLPASLLIYFRLLGRLGWYCTAHAARADLEAALDEVLEEDDNDEQSIDEPGLA